MTLGAMTIGIRVVIAGGKGRAARRKVSHA
jgi:hypothetical protein